MTKAMRWGLSALMTIGCVGLGSVVGCSDDDPEPVPTETDTGTPPQDTGTTAETDPDTGTPTGDTGTMGDGGGDTGDATVFSANRGVTIVFGSPDFSDKYLCLGAFAGDPAMAAMPAEGLGPIGIPDASMDPTKQKPFPYGAVIPLPLSKRAQDLLDTPLTAVLYPVDGLTKDCKAAWADVKGDTKRWLAIPGKTIQKDDHVVIRIHGCVGAPAHKISPGECGDAMNPAPLKIDYKKLDTKTPGMFPMGTGPKVGLQFVHMSPFRGITGAVPSFQDVDVYFLPRMAMAAGDAGTDGGDAGTTLVPAGAPLKIASAVKYGDVAPNAVGVVAAGIPDESLLLITPKDVSPTSCTPGAPTCPIIPVPLKAFLAGYKATGGGLIDGTNQMVGLTGSPVPTTDATLPMGTRSIRVPLGKVGAPFPSSS